MKTYHNAQLNLDLNIVLNIKKYSMEYINHKLAGQGYQLGGITLYGKTRVENETGDILFYADSYFDAIRRIAYRISHQEPDVTFPLHTTMRYTRTIQ